MSFLIHHTVKRYRTKSMVKLENEESKTETDSDTSPQYRLTTRTAAQPASKANNFNVRDIVQLTTAKRQNLIVMN